MRCNLTPQPRTHDLSQGSLILYEYNAVDVASSLNWDSILGGYPGYGDGHILGLILGGPIHGNNP